MASFLVLMFSRFKPPSSSGSSSVPGAIHGFASLSQRKFWMSFWIAVSISCGIPWTFARYWVLPPITAWAMILFPYKVGFIFCHLSMLYLTLSIMVPHGVRSFVLFPTHAPKRRTASWSFAILIRSSSWLLSLGLIRREAITSAQWLYVPMGIISVFSMLNLAPETSHQDLSMFSM